MMGLSFVMIDPQCTELLQRLALYLVEGNVLPCKIKTMDGPYLFVEIELSGNKAPCRGELLIPHHCILFAATNELSKTLGFLPENT